jgi:phosphoribosyl 1,2-cyclic phosphodiesterase
MVRFTVLASGSKGNSAIVTGGCTRILVDAGLSCRELFRRMKLADEDPDTLDAIVVTHEHQDHINGLAVTARRLGIPVYFTEATHRAWMRWLTPRRQMSYTQWLELCRKQAAERVAEPEPAAVEGDPSDPGIGLEDPAAECLTEELAKELIREPVPAQELIPEPVAPAQSAEPENSPAVAALDPALDPAPDPAKPPSMKEDPTWLPVVEYFQAGRPFSIGDVDLSPFTIPHDAADPVGFVLCSEGIRIGFATDLGYIPPNVRAQLRDLDVLLLESNHDLEMLRDGPYPWSVKQRVLSRVGHLSNEATAEFLSDAYDGQATYVILAHLSENNNLPELARVAAERALVGRASLLANRLLLAEQHQPLSAITF